MKPIQLLYSRNIITRKQKPPQQILSFFMIIDNLEYEKTVEVHWAGEDNQWHVISADYYGPLRDNLEIWRGETQVPFSEKHNIPGNVCFVLKYEVQGETHWADNEGRHYQVEADCGVQLAAGYQLLNLEYQYQLTPGQKNYPITVAVDSRLKPRRVFVRWTADNWQTYKETPCFARYTYWNRKLQSNARNPNQYNHQIWANRLKVNDAYQIQYVIGCETKQGMLWDSNLEANYIANRGRLKVLTLNLHCYQEANQDAKFNQIVKAIHDLNIDIICLQEVAENWNEGRGDWNTNAAKVLRDKLGKTYHLHTDWSHIGFNRYREGVAVLSRYPFLMKDSGYVSQSHDVYSIHARKVIMVQVEVPYMGRINVFSCHLSWWNDGFPHQFSQLQRWANHKHHNVAATLLCGDFNIKAGGRGYTEVVNTGDFEDQYLKVTEGRSFNKVFRQRVDNWQSYLAHDGRIDYIFMKQGSNLQALAGQELFTTKKYGRVSDHLGYCVEFELR